MRNGHLRTNGRQRRIAVCGRGIALPAIAIGCLLAGAAASAADPPSGGAEAGVSVIQISDIHVDTRLKPDDAPVRGAETLAWVCGEARRPQHVATGKADFTAPPPAGVIATGDLTEFGVAGHTWAAFEDALRGLPCPLYAVPGNHDNTWVAMYHILRKRHGGDCYSFDVGDCHFICISSASPQEPVPCVDAKTRTWLKAHLDKLPAGTPVFLALHHPLTSEEFANPAERDTLVDLLRDYNVVLLLYGHGHNVSTEDNGGIPGVMGGSTYGDRAGYGLLSVQEGKVRYAYRYHAGLPRKRAETAEAETAAEPAWRLVYEAPLPRGARPRLLDIRTPAASDVETGHLAALRPNQQLIVGIDLLGGATGKLVLAIDGKTVQELTASGASASAELDIDEVVAGAHLLTATLTAADGRSDTRTRVFHVARPETEVAWRRTLPAAVKAGPCLAGDLLVIGRNDGVLAGFDRKTGAESWTLRTGGEILGTPAWSGEVVVCGSGDGKVYAVSGDGRPAWTFEAGAPVYGAPLIADGVVYVGDNAARMHAIDLKSGRERWAFTGAAYSIECRPAVWNDAIVFGAWDGNLYAVNREDGTLKWKTWGPKSSEGKTQRYFAPADCGPVLRGDALFVCDRGYDLGVFDADGKLVNKWAAKAAAIAAVADGGLLVRTTEDRLVRQRDGQAERVWEAAVPAGRFPAAPVEHAGIVHICSNRGRLSALDGSSGKVRWSYQVTPGFYVMAPPVVDEAGVCYVAGMDGTVAAVRGGAP